MLVIRKEGTKTVSKEILENLEEVFAANVAPSPDLQPINDYVDSITRGEGKDG